MGYETAATRGVLVHYGPRATNMKFGGEVSGDKQIKTLVWDFNYDDLPDGATTNLAKSIPANSTIMSAKLNIVTAFTSTSTTSDLTVGLEQADGTAIDVDGLITAAQATQTTIAVVGSIIDGSSGTAGALIGKTIGAAAGELVVTPSVADLLTGRARVVVEYMAPAASPA